MSEKIGLKTLSFFLILSLLIFILHVVHVGIHFNFLHPVFSKLIICAALESLFEGLVLAGLCTLATHSSWARGGVIMLVSFVPVLHAVDFILERMFNLNFWQTAGSFFQESLANMLELLYATNISLWLWVVGLCALCGGGLFFLYAYKWITRWLEPFEVFISSSKFMLGVSFLIVVYVPLKMSLLPTNTLSQLDRKVLPFKAFLAPQKLSLVSLPLNTQKAAIEPLIEASIGGHVYIFMIESLRDEAINPLVAPNLTSLGKAYYRHPFCIASANGTHLSWYAFFYGKPAVFWKNIDQKNSPYLEKLKDEGYEIHVFSSARLSYYGMDELILGKNNRLATKLECTKQGNNLSPFEADSACFTALKNTLSQDPKGKKAFIIFLDATHFGYSLPKNEQMPFQPYVKQIPYFASLFKKGDIEGVKNRYYNAIHSIDRLLGDFFTFLKNRELWDSSVMLITADHGEEFFEKGQIFHASHLSTEQLRIPFICKTPKGYTGTLGSSKTLSHSNMLPLLEALRHNRSYEDQSWQIAARYHFSQAPIEVALMSQEWKILAEYHPKKQRLSYKSLFDIQDQAIAQENWPVLNPLPLIKE